MAPRGALAGAIVSAMRLHHWPKNVLVFVPMFVTHDFNLGALSDGITAFVAFSLAASATYLINDLSDVEADRVHPEKRDRAIATGALPARVAIAAAAVLLVAAFGLAMLLPVSFMVALGVYAAAACAYTWRLKRMLGVDVVVLGCLYTLRVIAGDEATGSNAIGPDSSEWMIGFSIFFFLALAIVKRFTELSFLEEAGGVRAPRRAYRVEDLRVMIPLAAASAFSALTIFSRYIGSPDVLDTYQRPQFLWLAVPILSCWLLRLMLLANRLRIRDDPVIFALRDRMSQACGLATLGVLLLAW
jgi:4-hydroxybenzoate polyprenyltransferase